MTNMKMKEDAALSGYVVARAYRDGKLLWEERGKNIMPDVGISYVLQAAISLETSAAAAIYVGLLDNYTPVAGSTMTNFGGNEITNYSAGTRPAYTGVESLETVTNTASKASYTIGVGGATVYGAFLTTSNVKAGTTGTAIAGKLFASSRALLENDVLEITYEITGSSA